MFKLRIRQIIFLVLVIVIVLLSFKNIYALPNYYVEEEVPGVTKKRNINKVYDFADQKVKMNNLTNIESDIWFPISAYRRVYLLEIDKSSKTAKIKLPEDDKYLWVPLNVVKKGEHSNSYFTDKQIAMIEKNNFSDKQIQIMKKHDFTDKQIEMVIKNKIKIGSSEALVKAVLGYPDDINKTVTAGVVKKQYVYRYSVNIEYVYFENGKVTAWQQ